MPRIRFADCLLKFEVALSLVTLCLAPLGCSEKIDRPPNLILVVIDTARADHFGIYGYERDTTPHFDAFARDAILFENAFATSCWTLPTHASLFTGLLPVSHQANQVTQHLDGRFHTLAELVVERGYHTIAFSNNPWVSTRTNLLQGFEVERQMWRNPAADLQAGDVHPTNRAIAQWLTSLDSERPFFLFVNFLEPHWPYLAPRRFQNRFLPPSTSEKDRMLAGFGAVDWYANRDKIADRLLPLRESLYDAELAFADEALGGLISLLKTHGRWEGSLIAITSDHGENLGDKEHQGHGFSLYDSTLRVPMAIRRPGPEGRNQGAVRTDPVQLTDLFATFAAASGTTTDLNQLSRSDPNVDRITGSDLLAVQLPPDRPVVAQYAYPLQFLPYFPEHALHNNPRLDSFKREIRSLQIGSAKLIWGSDGRHELYDVGGGGRVGVESFTGEVRDRSQQEPDQVVALTRQLDQYLDRLRPKRPGLVPPKLEMDESIEESLRVLGYIR